MSLVTYQIFRVSGFGFRVEGAGFSAGVWGRGLRVGDHGVCVEVERGREKDKEQEIE